MILPFALSKFTMHVSNYLCDRRSELMSLSELMQLSEMNVTQWTDATQCMNVIIWADATQCMNVTK